MQQLLFGQICKLAAEKPKYVFMTRKKEVGVLEGGFDKMVQTMSG